MTRKTSSLTSEQRFVFLDYLRIFAFLSVLIGHKFYQELVSIAHDEAQHATIRLLAEALAPFVFGGAAGVVVFFLVSGYIITHVLRQESTPQFLIKRIFRIYPLYIAAVIAELAMASAFTDEPLPGPAVLIPRLLLIGDLFETPYALGGVEWTLRIEVLFYAVMALLKAVGTTHRPILMVGIFVMITAALYYLPAIPAPHILGAGYLNLYGPFLLIGSCIYLRQVGSISTTILVVVSTGILLSIMVHFAQIQPGWRGGHFAILAVGLFVLTWITRSAFVDSAAIRWLSALTYSVYLFHNWLWDYLVQLVQWIDLPIFPVKLQIVVLLLLVCHAMYRLVERPALKFGQRLAVNRKFNAPKSGVVSINPPKQP